MGNATQRVCVIRNHLTSANCDIKASVIFIQEIAQQVCG